MKRPGPVLGVPHVTCGTSGPAVALGWWFAWWVTWAQLKNRRKNHQWVTWRGWYSEYLKMIYSTSFCETKHCCVKVLKPNIVMSRLGLTIPGIEYSVYKNQYVAPGNMIGLEYPPDKQQTQQHGTQNSSFSVGTSSSKPIDFTVHGVDFQVLGSTDGPAP